MTTRDRFSGALLGLALGDALGAGHEGGWLERALWRLLGTTRAGHARFTDDTQMAVDVAASLVARGDLDPDDLALRLAASYRWSRGYGPGTAKVLKRIGRGMPWERAARSVRAEGSFGNGGAIRSPPIGLFFADDVELAARRARQAAGVTHAHPLAQDGAASIAAATAAATTGEPAAAILARAASCCREAAFEERLTAVGAALDARDPPGPQEIRRRLGNSMAAVASCPAALYAALRHLARPFPELLSFVVGLGGDVDSIAAMAGAIWGAHRGVEGLPVRDLERLEAREAIQALAADLWRASPAARGPRGP